MGTETPKLALYKPGLEDVISVQRDLNDNFLIIDKYIAFSVCTSSTRPAPYEGLKIYEEDTGLLYIYALGLWTIFVDVPPVISVGGRKAFIKTTTTGNSLSTTEASGTLSATFTSELNRRYWVEIAFKTAISGASQGYSEWFVRWAAGNSVTTSGTSINGTRVAEGPIMESAEGNAEISVFYIFEFIPNIAGNVTVGLFGRSGNPGYTVSRNTQSDDKRASRILVRDVGSSL